APGRGRPAFRARAVCLPRLQAPWASQGHAREERACPRRAGVAQRRACRVRSSLQGLMPTLKSLRKRIATVRSTQKITKAMKMVAAARLRRAQEAVERARPYAAKLTELFAAVAAGVDPETHPLLARRPERRIDLLVLTSDRGLCGGYNANLFRHVVSFLAARGETESSIAVVGRKGLDYYRRRNARLIVQRLGILTTPPAQLAAELGTELTRRFAAGESDGAYLLYNRFRSVISQVPTATRL